MEFTCDMNQLHKAYKSMYMKQIFNRHTSWKTKVGAIKGMKAINKIAKAS